MCVPWESNPQPFALLTQCSTTEPHRNTPYFVNMVCFSTFYAALFLSLDHAGRHASIPANTAMNNRPRMTTLPMRTGEMTAHLCMDTLPFMYLFLQFISLSSVPESPDQCSGTSDLQEDDDLSLMADPEEMDLLGEIFDTLSAQSSREPGLLYGTRSLDFFSSDSCVFISDVRPGSSHTLHLKVLDGVWHDLQQTRCIQP